MAPPKRALFSLNLDTDADHVYQKVEDHNKSGDERVKVLETKGPIKGHTDLSFITKPFENTVNRAVEEVIDGTGKRVVSKEGEIRYSTSSSSRTKGRSSGRRHEDDDEEEEQEERSNLNVVSKSKRKALEKKYDTSEL